MGKEKAGKENLSDFNAEANDLEFIMILCKSRTHV